MSVVAFRRLPVPIRDQTTDPVYCWLAEETVKEFPWQMVASRPAFTAGVFCIVNCIASGSPMQAVPLEGVNVSVTEPALTSAALGV